MPTAAQALDGNSSGSGTGNAGTAGAAAAAGASAGAGAAGGQPGAGAASNQPFWDSWTDPADKDVREWASNKNFPDLKTLARSARGYEQMIGADRAGRTVTLPADEYDKDGNLTKADEAGRKAYYEKIGVPQTADKYDLPTPADNPYPQFKQYMADVFHQNGVPARMATQIAKGWEGAIQKMEGEVRAQEDTASQADMAELERAWGTNYQERVALANRGRAFISKEVGGLSDVQQRALESVLGTSKFMTMMWKFGQGNTESRFAGTDSASTFGNTASDAQKRMDSITADRSSGKINDFAWRNMQAEIDQLRDIIIKGMA